MTAVKHAGVIRWPFAAAFCLVGAALTYVAFAALLTGRPENMLLRAVSLVAVGVVPASVIFAVPTFGVGVFLVIFRSARNSGVLLSVYCGAYLCGVVGGALAFVARS